MAFQQLASRYYKKIITILALALVLPQSSSAFFHLPVFTLNITKAVTSGDGTFSFSEYGGNGTVFNLTPDQQTQITTTSGQGNASLFVPLTTAYEILEDQQQGWNLSNAFCNSNNSSAAFVSLNQGVGMSNLNDGDVVNCTFTNTPSVAQKTPVLIVPGILGTEIDKGSSTLWPDINRMLKPFNSDSFMDPLAFSTDGTPLDNSLVLGQVLGAPNPKFDYTKALVTDMITEGYATSTNLSFFAYDWRDGDQKNSENFLKPLIDSMSAGSPTGKIDLIAHSQGGLIVKRLLYDHPEYSPKIGKLVFVGTPNLGAPFAAKALLYGDNMGVHFGPLQLSPTEIKTISQNMPSIYELLPSAEYFNHSSGYLGNLDPSQSLIAGTNYNFLQTEQALKNLGENSSLIDQANAFHSSDFDNMDFSNTGIQTYNIIGCQSGTVGQVLVGSDGKYHLNYRAGDGTVPIISASNIYGAQNYYSLNTGGIHGTMLTTDGIRQQIENIITGGNLATNKITQDPTQCHYNGEQVSVHSPVDLQIYDENGDHVGPNADGSFDDNIDGVEYDIIGHDKFAFLPPGHTYTVKLPATGAGTFSFDSSQIQEGQITTTAHYDAVPITASSSAEVDLNTSNNQTIQLDTDGNGTTDQTIQPSSIINGEQSQDVIPPVSTSTISGLMGQSGFYRGNATVTLSSIDQVIPGLENQTSGVLKTQYNLDGAGYLTYSSSSPISISTEGPHTLKFFSTDNAGNNEEEQSVSLIIDKTAPEFSIQFSPSLKDLVFSGTDNLSSSTNVSVVDNDNIITLTDQAGNQSSLTLKDKGRKKNYKAEIKSLTYNGQAADINKTILKFNWDYNKNSQLKTLEQHVKSRKDFNIDAVYKLNSTQLTGRDQKQKINQTLTGLVLLKVTTQQGDFNWSY